MAFQVRCLIRVKVRPFIRGSHNALLPFDTGMGYSHALNFAIPGDIKASGSVLLSENSQYLRVDGG